MAKERFASLVSFVKSESYGLLWGRLPKAPAVIVWRWPCRQGKHGAELQDAFRRDLHNGLLWAIMHNNAAFVEVITKQVT
jgi:hypothetical protein